MIKLRQALLLVLPFAFALTSTTKADIVTYDFTAFSSSATSVDPLASATDITQSGDLANFNIFDLGYATGPVLHISSPNGNTTAADVVADANTLYFSFTVTPNPGNFLDLTSLDFDAARGGNATPRGWVVRSSVDNFGANLGSSDVDTVRTTLTPYSVDLSGSQFDNLTSPVEFRIYTYSPNDGLTVEYDNFELRGAVLVTVPEPSGVVPVLLALGLFVRRRR